MVAMSSPDPLGALPRRGDRAKMAAGTACALSAEMRFGRRACRHFGDRRLARSDGIDIFGGGAATATASRIVTLEPAGVARFGAIRGRRRRPLHRRTKSSSTASIPSPSPAPIRWTPRRSRPSRCAAGSATASGPMRLERARRGPASRQREPQPRSAALPHHRHRRAAGPASAAMSRTASRSARPGTR